MTPPRVVLSTRAKGDLRDIEAWIADHDGEARAASVLKRIWKTMNNLAFMPGIGRPRHYLGEGLRAFPAAPWVIYYAPLADGIEVLRIIDGRRDLSEVFKIP